MRDGDTQRYRKPQRRWAPIVPAGEEEQVQEKDLGVPDGLDVNQVPADEKHIEELAVRLRPTEGETQKKMDTFSRLRSILVDTLQGFQVSADNVVISGSFGRRTSLNHRFDVDVVILIMDLTDDQRQEVFQRLQHRFQGLEGAEHKDQDTNYSSWLNQQPRWWSSAVEIVAKWAQFAQSPWEKTIPGKHIFTSRKVFRMLWNEVQFDIALGAQLAASADGHDGELMRLVAKARISLHWQRLLRAMVSKSYIWLRWNRVLRQMLSTHFGAIKAWSSQPRLLTQHPSPTYDPDLSPCFVRILVRWAQKLPCVVLDTVRLCKLWNAHAIDTGADQPGKKALPSSFMVEALVAWVHLCSKPATSTSGLMRSYLMELRSLADIALQSHKQKVLRWDDEHVEYNRKDVDELLDVDEAPCGVVLVDPSNPTNNLLGGIRKQHWKQIGTAVQQTLDRLDAGETLGDVFQIDQINSDAFKEVLASVAMRHGIDGFDFIPRKLRYQALYGHATFWCAKCAHPREQHHRKGQRSWDSNVSWTLVDVAQEQLVPKWHQKCRSCESEAKPVFDQITTDELIWLAKERVVRILTGVQHPQGVLPFKLLESHDCERCEKCKYGKRTCLASYNLRRWLNHSGSAMPVNGSMHFDSSTIGADTHASERPPPEHRPNLRAQSLDGVSSSTNRRTRKGRQHLKPQEYATLQWKKKGTDGAAHDVNHEERPANHRRQSRLPGSMLNDRDLEFWEPKFHHVEQSAGTVTSAWKPSLRHKPLC